MEPTGPKINYLKADDDPKVTDYSEMKTKLSICLACEPVQQSKTNLPLVFGNKFAVLPV